MNKWRTIPGHERYEVSSGGRVQRKAYELTGSVTRGYRQVVLGRGNWAYVHQLVARAFLGTAPEGMEVNHKNGNKSDNRIENLEYLSHADNNRHGHRLKGYSRRPRPTMKGTGNPRAILGWEDVRQIRQSKESQARLAQRYGVCQATISYARRGKTW